VSSDGGGAAGPGRPTAATARAPGFGQADLSNCEREQIHLAGSIQPHGALLVVSEPDHRVVQASDNAAAFLGLPGPPLGRRLGDLAGDLDDRTRSLLDQPLDRIPTVFHCRIGEPARPFDALIHRPAAGGLVIELEEAGPTVDLAPVVERSVRTVIGCDSLPVLADEAARLFKQLSGYDRVMIYRFDDEGHGEVFAEQREPALEPFLGLRYPASDIPHIARELYRRNRIRLLVDVDCRPVPLTPLLSPLTGQPLDMSLCTLRSMSPIHIQYLKNMGVTATLVASLIVEGRLWGLVACHHYRTRRISQAVRAMCELLAEAVATRIAALESFIQQDAELAVRRLEHRMIAAISRHGDWRSAFAESPNTLLQPLKATGAALLFRDDVLPVGEVPGTQQLRQLGAWLDTRPPLPVVATASLGLDEPAFQALRPVASGIIAVPVSSSPGEYLIWLRPERIRTLTWAGDPSKPVVVGNDPADLSPRRSFAQWHQLVEGKSDPWTRADIAVAHLIGRTVAGVLLQFRSVRMLIAQDQINSFGQQIRSSDLPVVIAGAGGQILLVNQAFVQLIPAGSPPPSWLDDLVMSFADPDEAGHRLSDLVKQRRSWRGETLLRDGADDPRPVAICADPVLSSPDRLLGFVIQFSDLGERRAADAARRRFQADVVGRDHRPFSTATESDPLFRKLLSALVGNAQLAALEITHGVEIGRIPDSLDSVRQSVSRAAELLQHLVNPAAPAADDDD
jgi:light-regulated signal transduction histidine kinase (bacteriophytochrome)